MMLAECSQMMSMLTTTNRNSAVIIGNQQHNHKFVIIAPVIILGDRRKFSIVWYKFDQDSPVMPSVSTT